MSHPLDRTKALPTERLRVPPAPSDYQPGVAPLPSRRRLPFRQRMRNLRTGGGWSLVGFFALLVGWSTWAYAAGAGQLNQTAVVLGLIVAVAIGLFAVLRLLGGLLLERLMGRSRRSAIVSHLIVGAMLVVAGVSLLRQVPWVLAALDSLR